MTASRAQNASVRSPRRLRPAALLQGALRLGARAWAGAVLCAGLVLLGSGVLHRGAVGRVGAVGLVLLALLLLLHKMDVRLALRSGAPRPEPLRLELEAGGALVLGTFVAVQAFGGASSPLHPLVYALVALLASQSERRVALPLLGLVLSCEALLLLGDRALLSAPGLLALRAGYVALFAALPALFWRGAFLRQRREWSSRLQGEVDRQRREAAEFRLRAAQGPGPGHDQPAHSGPSQAAGRAEAEELLARGAAVLVHEGLSSTVALLKHALRLHGCALYWYDGALRLKEGMSDGPPLRAEVAADAGALGTVVKGRAPLRLAPPKAGHVSYYEGEAPQIGALLSVPILEGEGGPGPRLLGVLVCDRRGAPGSVADVAFSEAEEALLLAAAEQLLRALQAERVFTQVERSRYEHERLYRASEQLNRALTPEQVHTTAFLAAGVICAVDLAALTLFDGALRRHSVVACKGEELLDPKLPQPLCGLAFPDNAGLVAMAVKNRHMLPQDGALREGKGLVFDDKVPLRGLESLLVLPLLCGGEVVGTMVLGARRPGVFGKDQRAMLAVLANQVAVSLENARMYKAMEAMATTDGLTALTNRRAFNERFDEMIQRAERQGKSVTLVLTDIDHFKKVNDTYGHPVGDAVLKRVAQVVQGAVRKVDMAARYGGEEFAVVLEMTDRDGARQLAERVRREVQGLAFHSEKGPFQCTLSLGMATFPLDGRDAKTLIAHADQALYFAKHNGRNQAVCFEDLRTPRRAAG